MTVNTSRHIDELRHWTPVAPLPRAAGCVRGASLSPNNGSVQVHAWSSGVRIARKHAIGSVQTRGRRVALTPVRPTKRRREVVARSCSRPHDRHAVFERARAASTAGACMWSNSTVLRADGSRFNHACVGPRLRLLTKHPKSEAPPTHAVMRRLGPSTGRGAPCEEHGDLMASHPCVSTPFETSR